MMKRQFEKNKKDIKINKILMQIIYISINYAINGNLNNHYNPFIINAK